MMKKTTNLRCYSELQRLRTFDERFEYLRLHGYVGDNTFGYARVLNQILYSSSEWRRVRREVIIRDQARDLGINPVDEYSDVILKSGISIPKTKLIVHHMNPITIEDITNGLRVVFDPEFLITTIHDTHNAIHYGYSNAIIEQPIERSANDTSPWRK